MKIENCIYCKNVFFSFSKHFKDLKDCKAALEWCFIDCNCFYNRYVSKWKTLHILHRWKS